MVWPDAVPQAAAMNLQNTGVVFNERRSWEAGVAVLCWPDIKRAGGTWDKKHGSLLGSVSWAYL